MSVSISWSDIRSLIARSMRTSPMRYWFSSSSPTTRTRRFTEVVDVVDPLVGIGAVLQLHQVPDRGEDVLGPQRSADRRARSPRPGRSVLRLELGPLVGIEAELVVHLEPTDAGEVVALRVEEEVPEEVGRRVDRRRITGTQAAIDLDDRLLLRHRLVGEQGVAKRRPRDQRIEVEQRGIR